MVCELAFLLAARDFYSQAVCFSFIRRTKEASVTSEIFESRAVINFFMIKSVLGQLCCILVTILIRLLVGNGR